MPGSIPHDEDLLAKLKAAILDLRKLGYDNLPADIGNVGLEQVALSAAAELRRVNHERTEALLASESEITDG
jgi:hypothetical protein